MAVKPKKIKIIRLLIIIGGKILALGSDTGVHGAILQDSSALMACVDGDDEDNWNKTQNEAADAAGSIVDLFDNAAPNEPDENDLADLAGALQDKVANL